MFARCCGIAAVWLVWASTVGRPVALAEPAGPRARQMGALLHAAVDRPPVRQFTSAVEDWTPGPVPPSPVDSYQRADGSLRELFEPDDSVDYAAWLNAVSGWDTGAHPAGPPAAHTHDSHSPHREWQILPAGLLYRSYLAGEKEPRIAWTRLHDRNRGAIWEVALGGRVGLLRNGTRGAWHAEGWQIDLEGAALPRVDPEEVSHALEATDYRVGLLWTRRRGPTAVKAGYYHISSHVGDEFLENNPGFVRINYVRDSLVAGVMHDLSPDLQVYGEIGYAVGVGGGAEPLEFQFGLQYLPLRDVWRGGAPFAAVNAHLREEVDFGGGVNVLAGWRWRGEDSGHLLRVGLQYYNGKSIQYSFFDRDEQLFGLGIWFDY